MCCVDDVDLPWMEGGMGSGMVGGRVGRTGPGGVVYGD